METGRKKSTPQAGLLGLADDQELWQHRDQPEACEELLRRHMAFARGLTFKFRSGPEPIEDLVQVAYLGLLNAIRRFDPSRGIRFRTFATPTIDGELKRYFRDRSSLVRIPRGLNERISQVDKATGDLGARIHHTPSIANIAEEMGTGSENVREALQAKQSRHTVPLETTDTEESTGLAVEEMLGEEDEAFAVVDDHEVLVEAVAGLSEREKQVLRMRFREEMTQTEIADEIGNSQMQVSRILRSSLDQLRSRIPKESI